MKTNSKNREQRQKIIVYDAGGRWSDESMGC